MVEIVIMVVLVIMVTKGEVESLVSRVKKGGERFEMLKADAEAQLEGANNRLVEVRCYALCTAQSFSYTPWILAAEPPADSEYMHLLRISEFFRFI